MADRRAWILNLDADLELGAGGHYQPTTRVLHAMRAHVAHLAAGLLGPDDLLVDDASPSFAARGLLGRAFCPTPRALAALRRAGASPEPHPSIDVLRLVNSRAFASALGATMPGAAFVSELGDATAILREEPPVGRGWRIKHAFGMAGRDQRVVLPGSISEHDLGFVRRGLRRGGVQIEPNVTIEQEFALHGMIDQDGSLTTGVLVRQRCDRRGAWLSTERVAPGAEPDVAARMTAEARRVAEALRGADYFGPFGVDAYSYRDRGGQLAFQPRSEINARYSMGFATGFEGISRGAPSAPRA
jgi:hypothetical protein